MNGKEKSIELLTRRLMEGVLEQPSSLLNARVMALSRLERRRVYRYYHRKELTPAAIFIFFVIYMLAMGGGLLFLKSSPDAIGSVSEAWDTYYPLVLTVVSGVSCFVLFARLDHWLGLKSRQEGRNK